MILVGIATIEGNKIDVLKDMGRVQNLIYQSKENSSNIGIAHTRWATHGKPSKENAHPHLDNSNTFSVVHNGIIENYVQLKSFLEVNGYKFYSQTDTEIIPNLIHYFYKQHNSFLKSVNLACKKLEGSYAICVLCTEEPNKIIVAKKDSPLVLGKGENENYICSDIPAILEYTKEFFFLSDFEFAEITKENIDFYDINLNPITKKSQIINLDNNAAQKNGYEDFMLKEIIEQPDSIRKTLQDFEFDYNIIKKFRKINIIACGTAMHAGLVRQSTYRRTL